MLNCPCRSTGAFLMFVVAVYTAENNHEAKESFENMVRTYNEQEMEITKKEVNVGKLKVIA